MASAQREWHPRNPTLLLAPRQGRLWQRWVLSEGEIGLFHVASRAEGQEPEEDGFCS